MVCGGTLQVPVESPVGSPDVAGGPVGSEAARGLGVEGPPAQAAWRLACSLGVHQLCRRLESPSSSAKGVGPVGQRPGLGDEGGRDALAWPPIWE